MAEVTMNGAEEFGMEVGLQNPLSFARSILPGGATVTYTTSRPAPVTNFVPTALVAGAAPGGNGASSGWGVPGFLFNDPTVPIPNNTDVNPGSLGIQSLSNLGLGRVSATNNLGGYVFSANSGTVSVLLRALKIQGR